MSVCSRSRSQAKVKCNVCFWSIFYILQPIIIPHGTTIHHDKMMCPIYMIQISMPQVKVCTGQGQMEILFLEHNFHILKPIITSLARSVYYNKKMCHIYDPGLYIQGYRHSSVKSKMYLPSITAASSPQLSLGTGVHHKKLMWWIYDLVSYDRNQDHRSMQCGDILVGLLFVSPPLPHTYFCHWFQCWKTDNLMGQWKQYFIWSSYGMGKVHLGYLPNHHKCEVHGNKTFQLKNNSLYNEATTKLAFHSNETSKDKLSII